MKRLRPSPVHTDAPQYPSLVELALPQAVSSSRRAFLRGAAVAGAAVAGAAVAGAAVAGAAVAGGLLPTALRRYGEGGLAQAAPAKQALQRVTLQLQKRYVFRHGNYELQRAVAQTTDAKLAQFLSDPKMTQGVEQALRRVLDAHSCVDLLEGKRLVQLQARLGTALADHYRKTFRRQAPAPTVVLFVGVPNDRCRGDCPAVTPVCQPPRP